MLHVLGLPMIYANVGIVFAVSGLLLLRLQFSLGRTMQRSDLHFALKGILLMKS